MSGYVLAVPLNTIDDAGKNHENRREPNNTHSPEASGSTGSIVKSVAIVDDPLSSSCHFRPMATTSIEENRASKSMLRILQLIDGSEFHWSPQGIFGCGVR